MDCYVKTNRKKYMSLSWENTCCRCKKSFDSWSYSDICGKCWTPEDSERDRKTEEEKTWKFRAENAEKKLFRLPKWLRN